MQFLDIKEKDKFLKWDPDKWIHLLFQEVHIWDMVISMYTIYFIPDCVHYFMIRGCLTLLVSTNTILKIFLYFKST